MFEGFFLFVYLFVFCDLNQSTLTGVTLCPRLCSNKRKKCLYWVAEEIRIAWKMFQSFRMFIIKLHRLLFNKISHWQNVVKNPIFKCIYIVSRDECLLFTLCSYWLHFLTHTHNNSYKFDYLEYTFIQTFYFLCRHIHTVNSLTEW